MQHSLGLIKWNPVSASKTRLVHTGSVWAAFDDHSVVRALGLRPSGATGSCPPCSGLALQNKMVREIPMRGYCVHCYLVYHSKKHFYCLHCLSGTGKPHVPVQGHTFLAVKTAGSVLPTERRNRICLVIYSILQAWFLETDFLIIFFTVGMKSDSVNAF